MIDDACGWFCTSLLAGGWYCYAEALHKLQVPYRRALLRTGILEVCSTRLRSVRPLPHKSFAPLAESGTDCPFVILTPLTVGICIGIFCESGFLEKI